METRGQDHRKRVRKRKRRLGKGSRTKNVSANNKAEESGGKMERIHVCCERWR